MYKVYRIQTCNGKFSNIEDPFKLGLIKDINSAYKDLSYRYDATTSDRPNCKCEWEVRIE